MPYDLNRIADFFVKALLHNPKFNSIEPVSDQALLLPEFLTAVDGCINTYKQSHPGQDVTFTETYRSNALQLKYYNNKASKLKSDGMHHFGIAADCIFVINGKRTYKGDIVGLRKIYKDNGLFVLGMWDALHVQYIPVSEQSALRVIVKQKAA